MDTIYSLFQKVVKEHENAPAIIENDRTMTFGELSNMVDMICLLYTSYTQAQSRAAQLSISTPFPMPLTCLLYTSRCV